MGVGTHINLSDIEGEFLRHLILSVEELVNLLKNDIHMSGIA